MPELLERIRAVARQGWAGQEITCDMEPKRHYDDPFPDVDPDVVVVVVSRWLTVVSTTPHPGREIHRSAIPTFLRQHNPPGSKWYENIAFVVIDRC